LAEFALFHDGNCPFCRREVAVLRALDKRNAIEFVDITGADFDPAAYHMQGRDLHGSLHGRQLKTGRVIKGFEVTRHCFRITGNGWMINWTALGPLQRIFDTMLYPLFARYRIALGKPIHVIARAVSEIRCRVRAAGSRRAR